MVTQAIDAETRQLLTEIKGALADQSKVRAAVQQLEEQMRGLPATFERKLEAMRRTVYDPVGRYRGVCFTSEDEARSFGLYVMGTVGRDTGALSALKSEFKELAQRAMSTDTEAAGGGLVPIEFSNRIQRLVEDYGVWAGNAFPMPMQSDKLTFQRRVGGLTVFKTGQGQAVTESQPTFATINLNADEWNTLTLYPKSLGVEAAVAIGELLALEIAQAFAQATDDAGFIGDGTSAYLDVHGITTRLVAINGVDDGGGLVVGSGNAYSELVLDDFLKVKGRTPRYAQRNGRWYMSSAFYWQVAVKLILSEGGVTAGEVEGKRQLMLLGDPVEITESLPSTAANSQVCALYGDLRLSSTHGQTADLMIEESRDVKFIERQVAVLATAKHAVTNHSLGDATHAGPVVGLITAAS